MAGKKSKFFRVATEGATTDGRAIERKDIEQMAKNYDPKRYGARVNMEHIRGIFPGGPFGMFGDVLSLKAEEVEDGKLALFAQIDPTDPLVELVNVQRQKVYTSIEFRPNFAATGEAYLVGLAVTDSPASLGTEMLQFAARAQVNPLADRKQDPDNLFTEAIEFTLEMEDDHGASLFEGFSTKIKGLLGGFKKTTDHNFNEIQQAIEVIADSQRSVLEQFSKAGALDEKVVKLSADLQQLTQEHSELVTRLSSTPQQPARPLATGGNTAHITDC